MRLVCVLWVKGIAKHQVVLTNFDQFQVCIPAAALWCGLSLSLYTHMHAHARIYTQRHAQTRSDTHTHVRTQAGYNNSVVIEVNCFTSKKLEPTAEAAVEEVHETGESGVCVCVFVCVCRLVINYYCALSY